MQKTVLPFLLTAVLATGCSQSPPSTETPTPSSATPTSSAATESGFQLAISEAEPLSFTPSYQAIDLRPDTKRSGIVLANYDAAVKPMGANSVPPSTTDGNIRVHIGIDGGPDAKYEQPLPPGEYDAAKTFVDIYTVKNGKQEISNVENEQGKVIIKTVTPDTVTGSLDITGDKGARIQGEFSATVVKKE